MIRKFFYDDYFYDKVIFLKPKNNHLPFIDGKLQPTSFDKYAIITHITNDKTTAGITLKRTFVDGDDRKK